MDGIGVPPSTGEMVGLSVAIVGLPVGLFEGNLIGGGVLSPSNDIRLVQ